MNRDTVANDPVPNSAAANPFAYVNDNPMTGTDPSGHGWFDWVGDAWNAATSAVPQAATWVNNNVIQPAVNWVDTNIVQPVVHVVQTVVNRVVDAYHAVTRWVRRT
ncbi:hypothetical protein FNH05_21230 [Amycolatopsis rhizosphaerae]|uniref:Uncharacterized protein n=1 Tax=Amycolatopsis rhizosphaerae TaxID=2053003 RepID=A0A558C728_9PSEU|nr:hypothetical protein [Amycolatopsis rhizosphaerae]TVT44604.1 hypothetical protein FNH05_21230 [Amycolatopsis rhizosphaerae]